MSTEQRLYSRYYYNAVIEFVYFTFLYLETYGTVSLNHLTKHIKFYKKEVTDFISMFEGKTFEDKLFQALNTLDCFQLYENRVKVIANNLKKTYLEDLVLSKCVDLILKGITNIDEVCKDLNNNSVIMINKKDLQRIINRNAFISITNNETAGLEHVHGLLGFEDHLYNSVINYFYEILFHGQILSVTEIKNHGKLLKFCGLRNMIVIFAILKCSDQFVFQTGYIWINKKSKKYPKKKSIDSELIKSQFVSRSLPVCQVVFNIYGSFLHKWSGEIGDLTESSGNIYCVIDFKNGQQGVFNICFNIAALKIISDIKSLRKHLGLRDIVEFDAEYYAGNRLDRCWRATRVKLISSKKFEYDETLICKLTKDTDLQREKCVHCCSNMNLSPIAHKPKLQKQLSNKTKTSDYDSLSDSLSEVETANGCVKLTPEVKYTLFESLTNLIVPNYAIMFGYVHVLTEDKVIAIARHKSGLYNIFFMKDSVYQHNDAEIVFTKGQKVLAFVPYIENLDAVCVSTLVYGLNEREAKETERSDILPTVFADQLFLKNTVKSLCDKFCMNYYKIFCNGQSMERLIANLKLKIEISYLYSFIKSQYKITRENHLLQFLYSVSKADLDGLDCDSKVFNFLVELSKYLTKYSVQNTSKEIVIPDIQIDTRPAEGCSSPLAITKTGENNVEKTNLSPKYDSLDPMQSSLTSSNSLKTCSSDDSIESFYSCEDSSIYKTASDEMSSNQFLNNDSKSESVLNVTENSITKLKNVDLEQPNKFETNAQDILDDTDMADVQNKSSKNCQKSTKDCKYLSSQSMPCLKSSVKKKVVTLPYFLRSVCLNCSRNNSLDVKGYVSTITETIVFLTVEIEGRNVILPVSKTVIPPNMQEMMKLYSCWETTIVPTTILNLSHVLEAKLIC